MSNEDVTGADGPRPFDVETIRFLVRLMSRHDLSEIDLSEGDRRVRLRRGMPVRYAAPPPPSAEPMPVSHAPATAAPGSAAPPAPAAETPSKLIEIKSPTPGTFYGKPDPDSEPFVKVGSRVSPDTVVCLVEAMKMYNDIKAECSGTVAEVIAENGQFVEYGTVLYRVKPD